MRPYSAMAATLAAALLGAACGSEAPTAPRRKTMAAAYDGVVVTRVSPDGVGFTHLDTFELELIDVQSSGGRLVAKVKRLDRGAPISVEGTFDADEGSFRFEAFEAALTSTRTEVVEALGGRADDDTGDGVADSLVGFINTSSTAAFATDGAFIAVERAERPALDPSKLSATVVDLGRVVLSGAPGAAEPESLVELLVYAVNREQPDFRSVRSDFDGSVPDTNLVGIEGDVVVVRVLRAGQRSAPAAVRVVE